MKSRRSFLKSALAGLAALTVFGAQPNLELAFTEALPEAWGPRLARAHAETAQLLIKAFRNAGFAAEQASQRAQDLIAEYEVTIDESRVRFEHGPWKIEYLGD